MAATGVDWMPRCSSVSAKLATLVSGLLLLLLILLILLILLLLLLLLPCNSRLLKLVSEWPAYSCTASPVAAWEHERHAVFFFVFFFFFGDTRAHAARSAS